MKTREPKQDEHNDKKNHRKLIKRETKEPISIRSNNIKNFGQSFPFFATGLQNVLANERRERGRVAGPMSNARSEKLSNAVERNAFAVVFMTRAQHVVQLNNEFRKNCIS